MSPPPQPATFLLPLLAKAFPLPEVVPRPPGTPSPATSQERSGLAAQEPSRRRRPLRGQRDKRKTRPGGFSINVFGGGSGQSGLPSSSYSISDGERGGGQATLASHGLTTSTGTASTTRAGSSDSMAPTSTSWKGEK